MSDLIAAIATPALPSAIGILRLSGPGAARTAGAVFRPEHGRALEECEPHRLIYGTVYDREGRVIDRALATWSRGPASYTGEDTAEIQCHGSPTVLALGLEALLQAGARQAGPGEFTKRAFLNGRLDLTQAEAVADLIDADSPAAVHQAAGQLSGALGRRVGEIYDLLVDISAHFHAVLDYPDEDIDPFQARTLGDALERAEEGLNALLATYRRGRLIARGIPCAIVGRPNAGKSSLLNALLGYERAIVTDRPGTTRDTVEEKCTLGGLSLRLIDTAGLRETADEVERLGVDRSRAALEEAELVLVVWDASTPVAEEDVALLEQAAARACVILVWNKCDLSAAPATCPPLPRDLPVVEVSAKTGAGLAALEEAVSRCLPAGAGGAAGELLSNARQAEAARQALAGVGRAKLGLAAGITPDAVLLDLEEAMAALGQLTGSSVREDVTARIFQRFCVGK